MDDGNQPVSRKESLIRLPLRLGDDAFTEHRISDAKVEQLIHTFIGFKHLITVYEPLEYMACATSAMREADNGPAIMAAIRERSGIACQVIDGKTEADMIYANHIGYRLDTPTSYLYIDVGGGSTELTLFAQGQSVVSHSFDIGTVRLLRDLVPETHWKAMKQWIKDSCTGYGPITAIGSGGNINKINKLLRSSKSKSGTPIGFKRLKKLDKFLRSYTFEERVSLLALRPDRADVIIPACQIYLSVMKWANISDMYIPQIGLVDGMVQILYEQYKKNRAD
jgi:exopolyphosphatase/guanosine-5'-triphosphate,3'-diphosphate pyrophosphatase